ALDIDEAVEIIAQACRGLDYAHRNGVIHRDVKPGNLLVSDAEVVKLADFGIARAAGQSSITQVGSVLGTAAYLAPEQARGEEAGPQADIYSLGVVTYQLLSGRLPYEANSLSELTLKQQREAPASLESLNPNIPPELAQGVMFALAIDKERRPADAISFAEALRKGSHGIQPPLATASTAALPTGTTRVAAREDPTAATRMATRGRTQETRQAPPPRPARRLEPRPYATDPYQRPAPVYADERGRSRGGGRLLLVGLLIGLLCAAAVAVALAVSAGTSPTLTHIRTTVTKDANSAINAMSNLISQYTK
ncbi:MAG TPA: protein kinase, partial [Solirubrobacteraceae bacterium]|nr:protein kinase [Solirubrobacteraceae bacterium]